MPSPTATKQNGGGLWSLAALVRSASRDGALNLAPGEGDRERRVGAELARGRTASVGRSAAVLVPPRAAIITGQTAGSLSTGGALVKEQITVADVLRPELVLTCLGVRRVELPEGYGGKRVVSPSKVTVKWNNEYEAISSEPREIAFGSSSASPRECEVTVEVSRRYLRDAAEAEELLQRVIRSAIASEVERAALVGTGQGPEPLGLLGAAAGGGIREQPVAGAVPVVGEVAAGLQSAIDAGARVGQCGVLLSAANFAELITAETPGGDPVLRETRDGWTMAGRPAMFSEFLPTGSAVVGEFSQVQIVAQGIPSILVNPYTKANTSVTRISIFDYWDVTVARPGLLTVLAA